MNDWSAGPVSTTDALAARLAGRYEVQAELGEGAGGTVFLARDLRLDRLVALKTILDPTTVSAVQLERFRYEIRVAATMRHPNIVQIHEVLDVDGRPVCVMEHVAGRSLQLAGANFARTAEGYDGLATLFAQIAQGIAHAHTNGIIHRDIKPANVVLSADGVPKILDFGIAKPALDARLQPAEPQTHIGELIGTPPYMSPEQAAGDPRGITASTDIYSFGATLYYCLTRRLPHTGTTLVEVLARVGTEAVVPPRAIEPTVPRDLEAICLKAMAKQPAERYPSALACAEDLRNFLARRPVLARRYDLRESFARAVAQRKELFVASLALILVMFAGLVSSQYMQFTVARQSLIDDLRASLEGIAATAALSIPAADIERIRGLADRDSPAFVATVTMLKRIKAQNPKLVYVYVMREAAATPGMLEVVAENDMLDSLAELDDDGDGVLEGREHAATIGEIFAGTANYPALRAGLQRTTSDPDASIVDEYGVSLSGYSPIRNAAGEGIAVLGVDMKNDDVVRTFREIRRAFVFGVALASVLALALLGFVMNWILSLWTRRGR